MSEYGERLEGLRGEIRATLLPLVLNGRLADLAQRCAEIRERTGITDAEWRAMSVPDRERVIREDRKRQKRKR